MLVLIDRYVQFMLIGSHYLLLGATNSRFRKIYNELVKTLKNWSRVGIAQKPQIEHISSQKIYHP